MTHPPDPLSRSRELVRHWEKKSLRGVPLDRRERILYFAHLLMIKSTRLDQRYSIE